MNTAELIAYFGQMPLPAAVIFAGMCAGSKYVRFGFYVFCLLNLVLG